jgi:hypothetical protein
MKMRTLNIDSQFYIYKTRYCMGSNISTIQKHLKNEAKSYKTKNSWTCL